jgi:2',3'-cyclic-nucleotide 2'-phosphodiesterase (5'-nucleotidase family)
VRIYHTSDLHDRRGIVQRLLALRADAPGLLVDCGDALRGSQTVYFRREPIVAELDEAAYDVQAVGNREFHYLFPLMAARMRRMHHPVVCANLSDVRGRTLPFLASFDRHVEDESGAWDVRMFGLLVPQYPDGSPWERAFGWRFLDPYETAAAIARRTPPSTTLIALSHLGLRADRELARRVPRLDLVLGGHSHDTLHSPQYVGSVPIVHAGPYGEYVSRTELVRDGTRARIDSFALLPLLTATAH